MKILGAGGHAKVIIDIARLNNKTISEVYDDDSAMHGSTLSGFPVEKDISPDLEGDAIIGIGDNKIRKQIDNNLKECKWETLIHPSAVIGEDVEIGEGSVIMAGSVIQPGTTIGRHVIVNTGAKVDHDSTIGDFAHIAPNCCLGGSVNVHEGGFIGLGASVINDITIEKWTIIGAGAVVTNNIKSNCTAVGIPAKVIKSHNGK